MAKVFPCQTPFIPEVTAINPDLLPTTEYEKIYKADSNSENYRRVIADYITVMTEQYLFKMHQRIFGANKQNTVDIIKLSTLSLHDILVIWATTM